MRTSPKLFLLSLALTGLVACGGDDEGVSGKQKADASGNLADGAIGDGLGLGDAAAGDGTSDSGSADAGAGDAGASDSGPGDTAAADTGAGPTPCTNNTVCKSDQFCALYYNGVKQLEGDGTPPTLPGWANICEDDAAGTAQEGETCDPIATDADKSLKLCVNASTCMQGTCTALCETDAHCPSGTRCGVSEYGQQLPSKAGGQGTAWLPIDLCVPLPGDKAADKACTKDGDCGSGQVCRPWVKRTTDGFTSEGRCVTPEAGKQPYDGACGIKSTATGLGKLCDSTLCLYEGGGSTEGVCTSTCDSAADCPKTLTWGGTTFPTVCESLLVNHAGTEATEDDVYIPHCVAVNQQSSLKDCAATRACDGTEACMAFAIARGPDTAAKVEYRCEQLKTKTQPAGPTLDDGAACDPFAADVACKGGYCRMGNDGKGFCSQLCLDDKACGGGLSCDKAVALIPRKDASKAAVVGMCGK